MNDDAPIAYEDSVTMIAHFKNHWFHVPLNYVPLGYIENGFIPQFKFTFLEGEMSLEPQRKRCVKKAYEVIESMNHGLLPIEKLSRAELKTLSIQNNIPLTWLINQASKTITTHNSRTGRRKTKELTSFQYSKLSSQLKIMDKRVSVIIGILWFLNGVLKKANDCITLEEVLRLKLDDVACEEWDTSISLQRNGRTSTHIISYLLPDELWYQLLELLNENSLYVFSGKNYIPLTPHQVLHCIRKAAKQVGFNFPVSSLSFRPNLHRYKRSDVKKTLINSISSSQWDMLCREIPEITKRRGVKSKYSPKLVLEAMLSWRLKRCSLRKWPFSIPSSIVESQHRRWLENGIFNKIIALLKIEKTHLMSKTP